MRAALFIQAPLSSSHLIMSILALKDLPGKVPV
jgi:hypothetical protein